MAYRNVDTQTRDATMKAEYATNAKMTMKLIAQKYGMSEANVQHIGKRDKWAKARTDYLATIQNNIVKETSKSISQRVATINSKHFRTWEKMLSLINMALDDYTTQLIHVDGPYKGDIKLGKLEAIAKVMLMIQQGQRIAKGISDPIEVKKLEIAFKRLELEAKKLAGEPDEITDDGFDDALDATAQRVWGDINAENITE